ncbi:CCHC-type domain-containing protein [Abeliophyllum distichum]|uniref:CCHC-type domain-containing protein n=1 Tax=Abeliophyllum distichum TaxID=126358 RepID=A0ABD1NUJ9_9LAMI
MRDNNKEMMGRIDRYDTVITTLLREQQHGIPNVRRRDMRDHNPMAGFEDEDDYNYVVEMGRMMRRGDIREKTPRGGDFRGHDGVDRNLENIKMKIHFFQGRNNLGAYLEWEMRLELIFDCHIYSEEKKVKLAVIEFTDYAFMWWGQLVTNRRRNHERPVETWVDLKALMRRRFVPSH